MAYSRHFNLRPTQTWLPFDLDVASMTKAPNLFRAAQVEAKAKSCGGWLQRADTELVQGASQMS
jgi:hypothetical protein